MKMKEPRVLVAYLVQDLPYGVGEIVGHPKSKAEALIKARKCMPAKDYQAKQDAARKALADQEAKAKAAQEKKAADKKARREAADKRALESAQNAGPPANVVQK